MTIVHALSLGARKRADQRHQGRRQKWGPAIQCPLIAGIVFDSAGGILPREAIGDEGLMDAGRILTGFERPEIDGPRPVGAPIGSVFLPDRDRKALRSIVRSCAC
ncbi:hypothetical protein MesoLjLb_21720 [Mesorhizobium sp. L-8-3]|nr:hypothetical protein MesoLjLb_21720 [Mesorhizobium sp. L-8-3]